MPFYDHSLHYYHEHKKAKFILDMYIHVYVYIWHIYINKKKYIYASARAATDLFLAAGSLVVSRKCFTHKATRKPVLKPNHYGATYDYSREWVWCGQVSKAERFRDSEPGLALAFTDFPVCVVQVLTALVGSLVPCHHTEEASEDWFGGG